MSVHYKFKSALDYDTVTFDGLHISVGDLKAAISQQKRIGKTSDFDLQITNAQTKEVYVDDNTLIPKNTSLLVARVPLAQQPKKQWDGGNSNSSVQKDVSVNKGSADLSRMEGSEQDKINAMISQSTFDYDPSNYQKIRGQNQRGIVPTHYICYKCQKRGHWIKDCPLVNSTSGDSVEIRRSTGIPRSFMVPVDGPKAPGAMMTPGGTYAVPVVDREAYLASESAGGAEPAAGVAPEQTIPDDLICSLCRDLLTDAVMIPCCGNSFCDECVRGALLESEDHECPDCREKEISPTTLIPNRYLRSSVSAFRNQTGYSRRMPHRPAATPAQLKPVVTEPVQPPPNGQAPVSARPSGSGGRAGSESDASGEDNITVTLPPAHSHNAPVPVSHGGYKPSRRRHGPPPHNVNPKGTDAPLGVLPSRLDDKRSDTPTVDERREPMSSQLPYKRGPPFHNERPPSQRYNPGYDPRHRLPAPVYNNRFPLEKYQPPPPGIKDSPSNGAGEDPLEAFNRMIREKEERAKRREEERRRLHSASPLSRSRSPRSPRSPRPRSRTRSRTPALHGPRLRSHSRPLSRPRYSRSRSLSRGRSRRSPWSPRRRRSRDRSLSLTRSPSPRRRQRSPPRYRTPLRSPPPRESRSPPRPLIRTPPPRNTSPPRFAGVYDGLTSPRRNIEPPYGPRYSRNAGPPTYPLMVQKMLPPVVGPIHQEQPGIYRGRYDAPPFEDAPPGIDAPIPGYEPSPFEKPSFGPPVLPERERLLPGNYREGFRQHPYAEGAPGAPLLPELTNRYREGYRGAPPFQRDVAFREQQFRDQPPQQVPFATGYRGPPPAGYRDNAFRNSNLIQFRDGPNAGFRDNPAAGFRDIPPGYRGDPAYRPPSNPREPAPGSYHDPNYRENYRDDGPDTKIGRDHGREYKPGSRSRTSRRGPNPEHDKHRDRERFTDNREQHAERNRDVEKKVREDRPRDERFRDERYREYEKGRDREYDRSSTEKKIKGSPKRYKNSDYKEVKDGERDSKREKKDDRHRDKSSTERSKDHKDKEKKVKDKKKKKKEKEIEKKKKRDKKDKKEKESGQKDNVNCENNLDTESSLPPDVKIKEEKIEENSVGKPANTVGNISIAVKIVKQEKTEDLYEGEGGVIDKNIIENYLKPDDAEDKANKYLDDFDGIELQIQPDELDLKADIDATEKEMLAPLPELSKWEVDEDLGDRNREPGEISSPEPERGGKITSEVIKRAENAIFTKTTGLLRPIEIKKISSDRAKLYSGENRGPLNNTMQITVPVTEADTRLVDFNDKKSSGSKTPPRLSVKERLGGKIEDIRRGRDNRIIHSTVERVKSRSKTPKRENTYRRVTIDRDRGQRFQTKGDDTVPKRIASEAVKAERSVASEKQYKKEDKNRGNDGIKKKQSSKLKVKRTKSGPEAELVKEQEKNNSNEKINTLKIKLPVIEQERKKSILDESHFEPDYDETVESESEVKDEPKKRERSKSPLESAKKFKGETETIKLDLKNVKKKDESVTESSSYSSSSSSTSSEDRKRKHKKKRSKRKKKRAGSDTESDSDSSSDDYKKKKKKRKHKKKSAKKKKKSKTK